MQIRAQLFDGTILEFPEGTSPDVINSTAKRMTDEIRSAKAPGVKPEERGTQVFGSLGRGFEEFGDIRAGYSLAASQIVGDKESVARKMAEAKAEISEKKDRSLSVADIQRIYREKGLVNAAGAVPQFLIEQTLQALPIMAPPLAAGAAATALTAPVLGPFAPVAGAIAGIGTYGAQTFGSGVQRQAVEKKTPEEIELGKAAAASAIGAPLGYFMDRFVAMGGAKSVKEVAKELASRKAAEKIGAAGVAAGVAGQVGKGAGTGFLAEAPTEFLESVLDRWQAGLPLTGEEANQEYLESFITGGGVGGTIGGVSRGARTYAGYRGEVKQPEVSPMERIRSEFEGKAPAPSYFEEASPLENPYGNVPASFLEETDLINQSRKERGQSPLTSFSIEDIVESGLPQEQVDGILAKTIERAGLFPDQAVEAQDVIDAALQKGVDTEQQGFRDFLRRASGAENPEEMTPVQRVAAFGAIQNLPEGVGSLPTGTNAQSYTEAQYKSGLKAVRSAIRGGASRDNVVSAIQKSGVENIRDAQAILQAAIKDGQVGAISTPVFNVMDDFGRLARTYETREQADQLANRLNGNVVESSLTRLVSPEFAGQDIRPGTYKDEPVGFEVRAGDTLIASAPTIEEADQKADRLGQIREKMAFARRGEADKINAQIAKNNESLEMMEAQGLLDTKPYKAKQKEVETKNKKLLADQARLNREADDFARPLLVGYGRPKPVSKKGFTRFEDGRPVEYRASLEPLPEPTVEAPAAEPAAPTAPEAAAIDALQKKLMPALKRFGLENVGLRVVKNIEDGGVGADGAYANLLIQVALSADNPMGVMRHEVIHALKELGAFTPKEWRVLESKAKSEWIDRFIREPGLFDRYQQVYQDSNGSLDGFDAYIAEEAIAEAFKYFDATKPPPGLVGNLFGRIRNFFASLKNALQGSGFQTAEEVFGRIEEGKVAQTVEPSSQKATRFDLSGDKRPFSVDGIRIYNRDIEALVKKVGDRIAGMQTGKTLEDVRKSVNKLKQYSKEGKRGAEWYERSAKAVVDMFDGDKVLAEKFFQLIAITSANTEVAANFTKTYNAWNQFVNNKPIRAGTSTENKKIEALLYFGIDWDGRKTNTFYNNLMEAMEGTDSGRSTIDLHMARMLFDRNSPTEAQYQLAENMVRLIATKADVPARQVQAASWVTQKAKTLFEDYRKRGLKKKLNDKELREYAFERAIVDYAHLMERKNQGLPVNDAMRQPSEEKRALTQNITGEVIPSTKSEMSQVAELSIKVKQELNDKIIKENFIQRMAEALGIQSKIRVAAGTGGYEGSITPNLIVQVVNQNPEVSARDAAAISAAMTYVFKQDAVPYFRADPRLLAANQHGYRITFDRDKLTLTQERALFKALRSIMGDGAGYTKMAGNEMVLINFRGEDGKPFLMDDLAFANAIDEFKNIAGDVVGVNKIEKFGVESEYPYHDWKDDTSGTGIIAGLYGGAGGRSDIQQRLDSLRKSFVDSARESVRSAGIEPRFSLGAKRGDPRYGKRVTTDTIEVDGGDRPTRTSKGTLIFPTEEGVRNFWRWFGNSVFVDEDGRPLVMYHGTAADIQEFIPKQANAIFITPESNFAASYFGGVLTGASSWSEEWMVEHYDEILSPEQIESAKLEALKNIDPETKKDYRLSKTSHHSAFFDTAEFIQAIKDRLPSRANVIPLFVKAENPFNYSNENHVRQVIDRLFLDFDVNLEQDPKGTIRFMNESGAMADREYSESEVYKMLNRGYWPLIEQAEVQDVIRELGFDGFSVQENLVKNYGVFDPNQVKSSVGNDGNFSDKKSIKFSLAQSKTPQFKRWFGNSKIVDKNGNPLMMYHATPSSDEGDIFSVFNKSDDGKLGQGIYTTALSKYAESFAPTGAVMPLWVSIQNPLYIDLSQSMQRGRSPRDILRAQMGGQQKPGEVDYLRLDSNGANEISDRLNAEIKAINGKRLMDMSGASIRRTLQRAGYDGIVVRDADGNFVEVNAFEPTQIKSATGNRGTFSRANKDIRYSLAQTKTLEFKRWSRNAPMVMAKDALNYDFKTGQPFVAQTYHGTNSEEDFTEFDLERGGYQTAAESAGMGVFSTNEPYVAGTYAKNIGFGRYFGLALKGVPDLKDDPEVKRLQDEVDAANRETNKAYNDAVDDAVNYLDKSGISGGPEVKRNMAKLLWETLPGADESKAKIEAAEQKMFEAERELSDYIFEYESSKIPQRIMPLYVRMENPKVYDAEGKAPGDFPLSERIAAAKEAGHDGVVFKNIADPSPIAVHYVSFNAVDIKSAIGNRGTFDPTSKDIRYSINLRDKVKNKIGQFVNDAVDETTVARKNIGIKDIVDKVINAEERSKIFARARKEFVTDSEAIERAGLKLADKFGDQVLRAQTSATASFLFSKRAAGVTEQALNFGPPVLKDGIFSVPNPGHDRDGLFSIFEPLARYKDPRIYQLYQFYGMTRRGARFIDKGVEKLLTPKHIRAGKMLEKEFPEFKEVFDNYNKFNRGLVKMQVDAGLLSPEMGRLWTMYSDYIPMYRQADGEKTMGPNLYSKMSGIQISKKYEGGTAKVDDFLETVMMNTRAAIENSMLNLAAQKVVKEQFALNTPGQNDMIKRLPDNADVAQDVIVVREKGKDVKYMVADPLLVDTMKGLNLPIPFEKFLHILGLPVRLLSSLITRTPEFLLYNPNRDSVVAYAVSGKKFIPIVDTVKNLVKIVAGKSESAEALKSVGIGMGYEFSGDRKINAKNLAKTLRARTGTRTLGEKLALPFTKTWEVLSKLSTATDLATRTVIYDNVLKETGDPVEAKWQALEINNFDRKGSNMIVRLIAAMEPFIYARITGMDVLYRAGMGRLAQQNRKTAQKAFAARASTMFALTALYWFLASDSEEYKNATQDERDRFWFIGPVKIAIPHELGALVKVVPERIMNYSFGTDTGKDVKEAIYRQISSALGLSPFPQQVKPIVESSLNLNWYTQRPIVPSYLKDVEKRYQAMESTSLFARKLGEETGLSPVQIDHVIRGYLGGYGTYVTMVIDSVIRSNSDPARAAMTFEKMPALKAVLTSRLGKGNQEAYNDLREQVDELVRTEKFLRDRGRWGELNKFIEENGRLFHVEAWLKHAEKTIKNIRELKTGLGELKVSEISPENKRKALEELEEAEISATQYARILRKEISKGK